MTMNNRRELNERVLALLNATVDFLEKKIEAGDDFPIDEILRLPLAIARLEETSRQEEIYQQQIDMFDSKESIEAFDTICYNDSG